MKKSLGNRDLEGRAKNPERVALAGTCKLFGNVKVGWEFEGVLWYLIPQVSME